MITIYGCGHDEAALFRELAPRLGDRPDEARRTAWICLLNEVNTFPGMTSYSRYPRMMAAAGLPLADGDRPTRVTGTYRKRTMSNDFVFVDELVSGIRWDAKYATWDNFTGRPVDGYEANRIVGATALCAALNDAREAAASLGFGLLLWDAYRPQRAVECFLRWAKQPENGRTKLRHYPNIDRADMVGKGYVAAKSGRSRPAADPPSAARRQDGRPLLLGLR